MNSNSYDYDVCVENMRYIENLPIVKDLIHNNQKLKQKNKELKKLIRLISANVNLLTNNNNKKNKNKNNDDDNDIVSSNDNSVEIGSRELFEISVNMEDDYETIIKKCKKPISKNMNFQNNEIQIKQEIISIDHNDEVLILETPEKNNIVYEIIETENEVTEIDDKLEETIEDKTIQEEELEEQEEGEEGKTEELEEEADELDEGEGEEGEEEELEEEADELEEEADELEEEADELEEEEELEEEADELEEELEEEKVIEPEVEEDAEVVEVTINGKTYYTTNEMNGTIYDVDENGDVSLEVGVYKNGKPIFTPLKN